MRLFVPLAALLLAAALTGCAGGGGGGSSSGASGERPVCSTSFASPNFVLNRDPSSGDLNRLLYWAKFPLRVAFRNDRTYPDGFGGTISVAAVATDAFGRWKSDTGGAVDFTIVGSADPAEIEVNVAELASRPSAGGTLGQTAIHFLEPSGRITKAVVTLNVWPGITRNEVSLGLRATSAHEFGHALFLLGHSENNADLMFPEINPIADKFLSVADLNSLRTSYCDVFSRSASSEGRAPTGRIRVETIQCHAEHRH
jgi:predicted Zn-dependent protease